MRTFEIVEKQQ